MKIDVPVKNSKNYGPRSFSDWYEQVIDYMLSHERATTTELAKVFGTSYNYMSVLTNNDLFKHRFLERRMALSEQIDNSIRDKLGRVASRGLDIIEEALNNKNKVIPLSQVTDITNKGLERLGYGVKQPAGVSVNVSQTTIDTGASREALEEARATIRQSSESGGRFLELPERTLPEPREFDEPDLFSNPYFAGDRESRSEDSTSVGRGSEEVPPEDILYDLDSLVLVAECGPAAGEVGEDVE